MNWEVNLGSETFDVSVESTSETRFVVKVNGDPVEVDACFVEPGTLHLIHEGRSYELDLQKTAEGHDVTLHGTRYSAQVMDERTRALQALGLGGAAATGSETTSTSMPGKVVAIHVEECQAVETGAGIIVVEAMKMENELRCARDGVVSRICVAVGDAVEGGAALVNIDPLEEE